MPWRDPKAIHIFAPNEEPFENNWVEQILGTTVKPVYQQYKDNIKWFWVTRYIEPYDEIAPPVNFPLPEKYRSDGNRRYIVFRISAHDESEQAIYDLTVQLAREAGCYTDPRGWLDYDVVADLGSDRFIHTGATAEERVERGKLVACFVDATIKLMIDLLVKDAGGKWVLEPSTHQQNPNGSVFESVHHLFCNATAAPYFGNAIAS